MNMTHPNILEAERNGMPETKPEEPKRIQCAHCKGYYPDDEIDCKPMCYECKENLDDYRRVMSQRNLFLNFIRNIQNTINIDTIKAMCTWILDKYKEE